MPSSTPAHPDSDLFGCTYGTNILNISQQMETITYKNTNTIDIDWNISKFIKSCFFIHFCSVVYILE